ncbi:hypothetical protein LEP1GSC085_2323 [Leptospira interrogans str. L0996]|nr:hypothetical protein LEP1GSC085_2323 [Leptospira interrogans str. L0996]
MRSLISVSDYDLPESILELFLIWAYYELRDSGDTLPKYTANT